MQKLTITQIFTTDKDKIGNPLVSKTGKPYTRMSIKTAEYGEVWVSGFKGKTTETWKVGDTVEAIITKSPNPKGGEYINFAVPTAEVQSQAELSKVLTALGSVRARLNIIEQHLGITTPEDYKTLGKDQDAIEFPDAEVNAEDIPF